MYLNPQLSHVNRDDEKVKKIKFLYENSSLEKKGYAHLTLNVDFRSKLISVIAIFVFRFFSGILSKSCDISLAPKKPAFHTVIIIVM